MLKRHDDFHRHYREKEVLLLLKNETLLWSKVSFISLNRASLILKLQYCNGNFFINFNPLLTLRVSSSLNPHCHDDEISLKRPRLTVDTSRETQPLCEALSSNESFLSSLGGNPYYNIINKNIIIFRYS